jgi:hypothetical protein
MLTTEQVDAIIEALIREARANGVPVPNMDDMRADVHALAIALGSALISGTIAVSDHEYEPREMYLAAREVCNQLYRGASDVA